MESTVSFSFSSSSLLSAFPLVRLTVGLRRIQKAFAQEVATEWVPTGHRLAEGDFISPVGNSAQANMLEEGGTCPGTVEGMQRAEIGTSSSQAMFKERDFRRGKGIGGCW